MVDFCININDLDDYLVYPLLYIKNDASINDYLILNDLVDFIRNVSFNHDDLEHNHIVGHSIHNDSIDFNDLEHNHKYNHNLDYI